MEEKYTFCRICEALCGLKIEVENNKVQSIQPDEQHVTTGGFACPKGLKQHHLYNSPDRLKYPMKRQENGNYERISWDQSFSEIGAKVKQIREEHGSNSIAMYVGTAAGFGVLHPVFAQGFMTGVGSNNMYASATQDCSNKFAVAHHVYGFPFTQPFPDLLNTDCLIVVGANPVISKWSFLQVPNPSKHLKDIERRGGKIFFVDPRKTESAKVAGEHIFIRPGTDVFFYLAFLNELIATSGVDKSRVEAFMKNYEVIADLAKEWTPEKTAEVTQIPAETLKNLVKNYREAKGAVLYSSTGVNMGGHGTLAFWIQEVINAVSGNLDRVGGALVSKGVIDFPKFASKKGILMRPDKSRIGGITSVNDAFSGGLLADEILTPGDGQIKALFVTGGNPLLTMANANKLREAFSQLELLVVLDIQPSETASIAHYQLACTSPLQRPDLPFIFPLMLGLQVKPYLQGTKAVVSPEYEQMDEASIYIQIAKAAGISIFDSKIAQKMLEFFLKKNKQGLKTLPQEGILNFLLRITRQKSFKNLLKYPHGKLRPPHDIGGFLGKRVFTDDKKVNLAPEILMKQAEKLSGIFEQEKQSSNLFKLISRRAVTTHNSWTHNYEEFTKADRRTNYLYLNPKDAEKLNLQEGDFADVSSKTATIRLPVKLLPELMLGSVAVPHGWGHQASNMNVANKTQGVNVNILAADGLENIDPVSGMVHLTGIPVEIKKAAQAQVANSWSGEEVGVWE